MKSISSSSRDELLRLSITVWKWSMVPSVHEEKVSARNGSKKQGKT